MVQVLTVLCNIAAQGTAYCQSLHQKVVLPPLISALALSDSQVVSQDMELLHLLFLHWPAVGTTFPNVAICPEGSSYTYRLSTNFALPLLLA